MKKPWLNLEEEQLGLCQNSQCRSNFVIIVGDSEVDKVITTILGAIRTGSTGDGKIFISPVNDAIDIGTRKKGETAVV